MMPTFLQTTLRAGSKFLIVFMMLMTVAYAVPATHQQFAKEAHAGPGSGFSTFAQQLVDNITHVANFGQNSWSAVSNSFSAWANNQEWIKEYGLDGFAWNLAQTVRQRLVRSVINWINSGFQGSPMFISDLKGFMLNILDDVAGDFILGTDFAFLCSPFSIDVRLAVSLRYNQTLTFEENKCSLTDVIGNAEGAFDDVMNNFASHPNGGWPAWFALTQESSNTVPGQVFAAETEMYLRMLDAQGREMAKYEMNKGFLDKMFCISNETDADRAAEECLVGNPGHIISEHLSFQLQGEERKLIEADEMNEIIGALVNQFIGQAFGGTTGILGLGGNSAYANYGGAGTDSQTILDAYASQNVTTGSLDQLLDTAVEDERRYNRYLKNVVWSRATQTLERGRDLEAATVGDSPSYTFPERFENRLISYRDFARTYSSSTPLLQELRNDYDFWTGAESLNNIGQVSNTITISYDRDAETFVRDNTSELTVRNRFNRLINQYLSGDRSLLSFFNEIQKLRNDIPAGFTDPSDGEFSVFGELRRKLATPDYENDRKAAADNAIDVISRITVPRDAESVGTDRDFPTSLQDNIINRLNRYGRPGEQDWSGDGIIDGADSWSFYRLSGYLMDTNRATALTATEMNALNDALATGFYRTESDFTDYYTKLQSDGRIVSESELGRYQAEFNEFINRVNVHMEEYRDTYRNNNSTVNVGEDGTFTVSECDRRPGGCP